MKTVKAKRTNEAEVPETWAEGEEMIAQALRYHDGRGRRSRHSVGVRADRLRHAFGEKWMAADPTQALAYLVQRICQRKGAGL